MGGEKKRVPISVRIVPCCMVTALALQPCPSHAVDLNYEIGLALLHSDNITLSPDDPQSDTVVSPQLKFEAEQNGSTLQFKSRGNLEYLDYLGGTFGNQWRGEFGGQLNWTVLPDRVNYVVEDYLSSQPVDVLTAFTPGNAQQINVFITGPSFYARFGDTTNGQVDLRYTDSYAEKTSAFNGNRYSAATRLWRQFHKTSRGSINLEATRARFDEKSVTTDYTRYDGYVGYTWESAKLRVDADVGYSRLSPDQRGDDFTSPLLRSKLEWQLSPSSTADLRLSYQFADAAADLVARAGEVPPGPIINDPTNPDVLVSPAVFRQRWVEVGYRYSRARFDFELRPFYDRDDYLSGINFDQTSTGGTLQAGYRLRPRLKLSLQIAGENRKFDDLSRTDKDFIADLGLTNQFSRHWTGRLDLQHRKRDSSVATQSYDENSVIVSFICRR